MSLFYRIIILSLLLSLNVYASSGGNGGSRGGGDSYSAEVFSIARGIAKKLRAWTDSGILKLTDDQVRKVEAIVDLSPNPSRSLLEVYSFERVYKHPELLPSRAADETTLINVYAQTPPRIEVGRFRWDGLKGRGIEKEMLVLHELLGAAGLLKNGRRIDDQFKLSYELKLKTLEKWENFREATRMNAMILFSLSKLQLNRDRSAFKQLAEQLRSLPQYDKAMHPQHYTKGKRRMERLQDEAVSEIFLWMGGSIGALSSSRFVFSEKVSDLVFQRIGELSTSSKQYPLDWSILVNKILTKYLVTYNNVTKLQNQYYERSAVIERMNKFCEDVSRESVEENLSCIIDFLSTGLSEEIDSVEAELENMFDQGMMTALDDLSLPSTPNDLPKH